MEKISGPVLEIDVNRARRNIRTMLAKAKQSRVVLRPHFKTHQSHTVAGWFREEGEGSVVYLKSGVYKYAAAAKNTRTISGYKAFSANPKYTWNFGVN